ncbi:precorrin-3B synthase [Enhydrobacter sp.]|uniref:precorrin-3B synthase n=1 Tax=Enhydrobacter sp. TaxID=1894999 RepID=UPI002610341B|nr:precorrin-3B synthase [Enhydrobacter sp.]WIM10309.1 MAG: Precorrin-3B synthase [Enhydrobacter sp.]
MSLAATIEIKGWCPGALRPMESGDGLLVRVKPWASALTLAQAGGLAAIAERLGNGHIDLTRRANLQLRGVAAQSLPELHRALGQLGLLDPDAEIEAARNIMVGPLAGAEGRAIAAALTEALSADRRLAAGLPAKFGWLVDAPGPLSIIGERADVALCLLPEGVALRVAGRWLGLASRDQIVSCLLAASRTCLDGRPMPSLAGMDSVPVPGRQRLGRIGDAFGIAAPFGRLEAGQLQGLVALAAKAGASELRLSPWRAVYLDAEIEGASALGLIEDGEDPLLRIDACPGSPACRAASVDARRDARRLAAWGFAGTLHVSGCAKGCARSAPADLVLVGGDGRYGIVRNGTARDRAQRTVEPGELATVLRG